MFGGGGFGRSGRRGLGGGYGFGPGGRCICPNCNYREDHKLGKPCNTMICPKCGTHLVRS